MAQDYFILGASTYSFKKGIKLYDIINILHVENLLGEGFNIG